jgi:hypothetical protein
MEMTSSWDLATHKEAYRLWFEYLKVARSSTKAEVRAALARSKKFYAPWEMDKADKFDAWWKDHRELFAEPYFVRELKHGEMPRDPGALVIEVPLAQSQRILMKRVGALIQAAFEDQQKTRRKGKTKSAARYHLSEGAEPKLVPMRDMLAIYRDVYQKRQNLRGAALLEAVQDYYRSGNNSRRKHLPGEFDNVGPKKVDNVDVVRNIRRYLQKAEKVVLNVAGGEFPGKY